MKAIILSAGQGKRLLPLTENKPKALLPVAGKTIIEWQIDTLLDAGITDIVTVTGFRADLVDELISSRYSQYPAIKTRYNPFHHLSDNLVSCWVARDSMNSEFLLINGDTLFEPALLGRVLESGQDPISVTVDTKNSYDDDDMKVTTEGTRLTRISKSINSDRIDAESIGVLAFRGIGPGLFRDAMDHTLKDKAALKLWYLSVIDKLADTGVVSICSINGYQWCEIDFMGDLERATGLFTHATATETLQASAAGS
jgi:choline kinase